MKWTNLLMSSTPSADRKPNFAQRQKKFLKSRQVELDYARKLRSVARQIGVIVSGFTHKGIVTDKTGLEKALSEYSKLIAPWAKSVAKRMLDDLARKDEAMWAEMGVAIGKNLRREIQNAPTGTLMQEALNQQVELITSLPI